MKNNKGFTIIELLVVLMIVGILAAVSISVINVGKQKARGQDTSKRAQMEKTCTALKAFYEGEGFYPDDGTAFNPLDTSAANKDAVAQYISSWPSGFSYIGIGTSEFSTTVTKNADTNMYKCSTSWRLVQECASSTDPADPADCDPIP